MTAFHPPEVPEELSRAGIGFRWALPLDLKFVAASWLTSAKDAFIKQGALLPLSEHAAVAAKRSARHRAIAQRYIDSIEHQLENWTGTNTPQEKRLQSLLAAQQEKEYRARLLTHGVLDADLKPFIGRQLEAVPPVVLYDEETPDFLIGWMHGLPGVVNYVYVKQNFRDRDYAKFLLRGLGFTPESRYTAMTRAGQRIWTWQR
jgi:hypothetical protein